MLPGPIFNTYTQYKCDTSKIATWLASTAFKCGYTTTQTHPSLTNNSTATSTTVNGGDAKPPKLKGRARKLAKEAAAKDAAAEAERLKKVIEAAMRAKPNGHSNGSGEGSNNGASGDGKKAERKHVVGLREFVPMAEAIAKNASLSSSAAASAVAEGGSSCEQEKPRVKISTGLIKLFRRCILARDETADWYNSQKADEDSSDDDENDGHQHFVSVLKQSLQVLVPAYELQELEARHFRLRKAQKDESTDDSSEPLIVTNAYGNLEIEDIDESALDALPSAQPILNSDAPSSTKPTEYEIEDDGNEWIIAFHWLWDDLHQIQDYLSSRWTAYKIGEIDLSTVSVVTNTAIDLVRRAEDDFNSANLKLPPGFDMAHMDQHPCNLYFAECCIRDGISPRESRTHPVPLEAWEQVEESYLHVYRVLKSTAHLFVGSKMTTTRPGFMGTYDPTLDRDTASPKRSMESDCGLLMDMIFTVAPYLKFHDTPNDDELLKGIKDHLTEKPPLWLVFACQVFIDTHTVLGTKGDQPFHDLYEYALEARKTLRGHDKFIDKVDLTGNRNDHSEHRVIDLHKEIEEWALNDKVLTILNEGISPREQMRRSGGKKVRIWKENELLKLIPQLCGMWKYCFQLQLQEQGIRLINDTMTMSAVHLYNALQQNGYLPEDCSWEDAEYLLAIHTEHNTFLGGRPESIEECTKRLAVAQGVSPQTFASGRRQGQGQHRIVYGKSGGKFLKPSTLVAGVFHDRFLGTGNVDLSLASIEKILGKRLEERRKARQLYEALGLDNQSKNTFEGTNKLREGLGLEPLTREEWEEDQEKFDEAAQEEEAAKDEPSEGSEHMTVKVGKKPSGCACGEEHGDDDSDDEEAEILDRWEKGHKLSIHDFLTELGESLLDEELDIDFDYFAFHRSTWRVLAAVQHECLPLVQPFFDETMTEILATHEGVTIIPGMLMLIASDPRLCPNLAPLKMGGIISDEGLKRSAESMKEFIDREGAAYSKREDNRLQRRADTALLPGETAGPIPGYFSGAVGQIRRKNVDESAKILRGMTLEELQSRHEHKTETEGEEGDGKKKKRRRSKKKKKAKTDSTEEGASKEVDKENMQPLVEEGESE